jgi:hypothetical protein
MKYINNFLTLMMVLSLSAQADVFKCKQASGKIAYQSEPCPSNAATQGVVKVKQMTPEETEAAKAKLNAWQQQQAIQDLEKRAAERERQADLDRQQSLELQRRSVAAQEQQAISAQQPQYQGGGVYLPYNRGYGNYNQPPYYGGGYPHHQHHGGWNSNMYPSFRPYQEPTPPPFRQPAFTGRPAPPIRTLPGFDGYR